MDESELKTEAAPDRPLPEELLAFPQADGFHPTVLGSYLAALAIHGGLTGASPVGLPRHLQLWNGRTVEVPAREAAIAQAAAAEALR